MDRDDDFSTTLGFGGRVGVGVFGYASTSFAPGVYVSETSRQGEGFSIIDSIMPDEIGVSVTVGTSNVDNRNYSYGIAASARATITLSLENAEEYIEGQSAELGAFLAGYGISTNVPLDGDYIANATASLGMGIVVGAQAQHSYAIALNKSGVVFRGPDGSISLVEVIKEVFRDLYPNFGSNVGIMRHESETTRQDNEQLLAVSIFRPDIPFNDEQKQQLVEIKERVNDQTGGPRGTGDDPHDPRGPWQMPGASGDRTDRDSTGGSTGDGSNSGGGSPDDRDERNGNSGSTTTTTTPGGSGTAGNPGKAKDDVSTPSTPSDKPTYGPQPILLDLDGTGISITERGNSSLYLDGGDGRQHRTAWAGAGDGVLFFDAGMDGKITEKREYVFTEWTQGSTSDLEAMREAFDTNGDGRLTAADAQWGSFKVMVTNPDGTVTAKTLAQLGITHIDLRPDATHIELPNGSVSAFRISKRQRMTATLYERFSIKKVTGLAA